MCTSESGASTGAGRSVRDFFRSVVRAVMKISAGGREVSLELYSAENEVNIPDPGSGVELTLLTAETSEKVLSTLNNLSPVLKGGHSDGILS